MKKVFLFISVGAIVYASSCVNTTKDEEKAPVTTTATTSEQPTELSREELVKKGEYLVNVIGCGDCHTPKKMTAQGPVPDADRLFSGYNSTQPIPTFDTKVMQKDHVVLFNPELTAAAGPWGVSFAANLTPDDTGIKNWTLENFKTAIRKGKFKGMESSRDLLPPMPWPNFKNLTNQDLEAIFLYFKSVKPVDNRVPNAIPPGAPKSMPLAAK